MPNNKKIEKSTNRSFGLVFFIVFLIIGLWPLAHEDSVRFWSLIIALIFLFLGILNSKILTPLNVLWSKFGELLSIVIAPIVMGIIFFLVVTPTGLIMKMLGKDLLRNKFQINNKSYWIKKEKNKSSMKKQF